MVLHNNGDKGTIGRSKKPVVTDTIEAWKSAIGRWKGKVKVEGEKSRENLREEVDASDGLRKEVYCFGLPALW